MKPRFMEYSHVKYKNRVHVNDRCLTSYKFEFKIIVFIIFLLICMQYICNIEHVNRLWLFIDGPGTGLSISVI